MADTARGAIWRVFLDHRGGVRSRTGCDTTFTPNTLCLDSILRAVEWYRNPVAAGVRKPARSSSRPAPCSWAASCA